MEAFYTRWFDELFTIATEELGVAPDRAETLVHEVLLASLIHLAHVHDVQRWLVAGVRFGAASVVNDCRAVNREPRGP
jgi:hypothetical protein